MNSSYFKSMGNRIVKFLLKPFMLPLHPADCFLPCDIPLTTHCSFPINPIVHHEVKNLAPEICEAFRPALSKENDSGKTFTETGYCILGIFCLEPEQSNIFALYLLVLACEPLIMCDAVCSTELVQLIYRFNF